MTTVESPVVPRPAVTGTGPVEGEAEQAGPVLTFTVHGTPAPQGSKNAYRNQHTGRIQQVESSKNVKPWREAVKHAAIDAILHREGTGDPFAILGGPVYVETTFTFARPKNHYRTGRNAELLRDSAPSFPISRGRNDIEKLVRATRDAMTDAGVWVDDSQVVDERNRKVYPNTHRDALPAPGAVVRVYRVGAS